MTTGPVVTTRETKMDPETGSDPGNAVTVDESVSPSAKSPDELRKSPEERLNCKIVDEDFKRSVEKMVKGAAALPENWTDLTVREQRDWLTVEMQKRFPDLPKSLITLTTGQAVNGDCKRSELDPRPEWLDHEKFLRGQRFALDNIASISLSKLIGLYALFTFEDELKYLIVTRNSSDPFTAFKRYLSTGKRVRNWYSSDPWTKGTDSYKDIETVRKMHAIVREKLVNLGHDGIDKMSSIADSWSSTQLSLLEDFRGSCPEPGAGQCPFKFAEKNRSDKPIGLNQMEMASTQFGFIGMAILFPERFGIHGATDEDLEAFCHTWRGLGYLLGIEDEYNFCNGTLKEVRQRSRDFINYWIKRNLREITPEWEHMTRCLMEGIQYYYPGMNYEHGVLFFAELLEIPVPRFEANTSYACRIRYGLAKNIFYWVARLPGIPKILNQGLVTATERALKYSKSHLEVLQNRSNNKMSKGIADTIAARNQIELETTSIWDKVRYLVSLSTVFLWDFPRFVKKFIANAYIGTGAALTS